MKGYTSTDDLASFMGASFTTAQQQIAALAIGTAETWLDTTIRHAWLETGPITEDVLIARSSLLRVAKPPVMEFTTVHAIGWPGSEPYLLDPVAGQYNVRSLRDGIVWVPGSAYNYAMRFVYVPNTDPVPDEVVLATLSLAAASLRMVSIFNDDIDPALVQRYVIGGELEIEFRKNIPTTGVAAQQVLGYLEAWTKGYVVV